MKSKFVKGLRFMGVKKQPSLEYYMGLRAQFVNEKGETITCTRSETKFFIDAIKGALGEYSEFRKQCERIESGEVKEPTDKEYQAEKAFRYAAFLKKINDIKT